MVRRGSMLVMGVLALVTILGVMSAGAVFAQTDTPRSPATPTTAGPPNVGRLGRGFGLGFGWGFRGGDTATFDAVAQALNLTPTQLFEQLHAGKTLSEIATAQGVDLSVVQNAVNARRVQAMKDKIAAAVADGRITQEQADWLLQGLDKGYFMGGKGLGFGLGGRGHGRGMMLKPFGMQRRGGQDDTGTKELPTPSTTGLGSWS